MQYLGHDLPSPPPLVRHGQTPTYAWSQEVVDCDDRNVDPDYNPVIDYEEFDIDSSISSDAYEELDLNDIADEVSDDEIEAESEYDNAESADNVINSKHCSEKLLTSQPSKKNSRGNLNNKLHACFFCEKLYPNIARHLTIKHSKEHEVTNILVLPKKSKLRRKAWEELVNKGDFSHNSKVIEKGNGVVIPKYRSKKRNDDVRSLIPCQSCRGFYKKSDFWKHQKHCRRQILTVPCSKPVQDERTEEMESDENDADEDFKLTVNNEEFARKSSASSDSLQDLDLDDIMICSIDSNLSDDIVTSESEVDATESTDNVINPKLCSEKFLTSQPLRENSSGKRKNKKHACFFCKKLYPNIARHLTNKHSKEHEVKKILLLSKKCNLRRKAWQELVNKGDFSHNSNVINKGCGMFIPKYRSKKLNEQITSVQNCQSCKGFNKKRDRGKQQNGYNKDKSIVPHSKPIRADEHEEMESDENDADEDYKLTVNNEEFARKSSVSSDSLQDLDLDDICSIESDLSDDIVTYDLEVDASESTDNVINPKLCSEEFLTSQPLRENSSGKRKNKKHACFFCKKLYPNIARHLTNKHSKDHEVTKILVLPKKCKLRRKAWQELVNKGDFSHNSNVINKGFGMFIPKYRSKKLNGQITSVQNFQSCKGFNKKRDQGKQSNGYNKDKSIVLHSKPIQADELEDAVLEDSSDEEMCKDELSTGKKKRSYFTDFERKAVETGFKEEIQAGKVPGKQDVINFMKKYPCFSKYPWTKVKFAVHNMITARKREQINHI